MLVNTSIIGTDSLEQEQVDLDDDLRYRMGCLVFRICYITEVKAMINVGSEA